MMMMFVVVVDVVVVDVVVVVVVDAGKGDWFMLFLSKRPSHQAREHGHDHLRVDFNNVLLKAII